MAKQGSEFWSSKILPQWSGLDTNDIFNCWATHSRKREISNSVEVDWIDNVNIRHSGIIGTFGSGYFNLSNLLLTWDNPGLFFCLLIIKLFTRDDLQAEPSMETFQHLWQVELAFRAFLSWREGVLETLVNLNLEQNPVNELSTTLFKLIWLAI